jgi:hypothetical protein
MEVDTTQFAHADQRAVQQAQSTCNMHAMHSDWQQTGGNSKPEAPAQIELKSRHSTVNVGKAYG